MAEVAQGERLVELLGALQLGDSFFPSGRYTLSHGLEAFAQARAMNTPGELAGIIEDYLCYAVARSEAVAVAEADRAVGRGDPVTVVAIDEMLLAMKLPAEASASSTRSGRQLLITARRLSDNSVLQSYGQSVAAGEAPGNHAVAMGVLAGAWGLSPAEAAAVEIHAYTAGLLGAALRLVRFDHTQAQELLHGLRETASRLAVVAAQTDYHEMSAFAPVIEIMQMRHESIHLRLFAS